ncbi:MAG: molybdate ABC transporter substrate-binding protein [Undibacterium sp.]|nr:molybdate ABC transporter substrate-binding protein [Opitutaceae bacterium]
MPRSFSLFALLTGLATASAQIENRKSKIENSSTVSIAAASDLVFCLDALNAEFAKAEPAVALKISTGSSGNFFAQIKNGAPFDVFLSADLRYPRELIAAGAAEGKSLTLYGIGRIVLWTQRTDLELSDITAVVRNPLIKKFAIANPEHAPYGRAAKQVFEKLGVWTELQPKLVLGENIAQTAQFVQTGNADAGIVALSLVLAPALKNSGRWVEIPPSAHAPLEQGVVLTLRGTTNPAAKRYLAFLSTRAARTIFDRYGFRLPVSP